jgi:Ca-activated chloride channel family protein
VSWFKWPWALAAMLLLPWLAWRFRRFRNRTPAIVFPRGADVALMPRTLRHRWIHLPRGLRLIALALLIAASAGPLWDQKPTRQIANSIGIQLLVDHSGSMANVDMLYEGRLQSRLDVVKSVSHDFILGTGRDLFGNASELRGRPSDMIGLIAFAADPITLCPLTLTHEQLQPPLNSLRIVEGEQDGTAIGDAVALAAARFELLAGGQDHLKSKVIILITDGENNLGARSLEEAAALAHQWGVRIYAIAIRPSTTHGDYEQQVVGDLETLSGETNGTARVASDGSALRSIYAEIDRLERSDVSVRTVDSKWGAFTVLVLAALSLLALELLLQQTWLRRIP